jgi:hypothetical protein
MDDFDEAQKTSMLTGIWRVETVMISFQIEIRILLEIRF